jgi:hypothetical protein
MTTNSPIAEELTTTRSIKMPTVVTNADLLTEPDNQNKIVLQGSEDIKIKFMPQKSKEMTFRT